MSAADAPAVLTLFEQMSERSLYYRFMMVPHLDLAQVRRLLALDDRSQVLVAERAGALCAIAGYYPTEPGVQREKAGKRRSGDDRPAEHEVEERASHARDAAHDGGADSQPPVGVLIEAQHLAGEGHSQSDEKEQDPHQPGELPGILVRTEEEDLHHVDEDDRHHEVRAPAVQGANEPSGGDVVVQDVEDAPRLPAEGT